MQVNIVKAVTPSRRALATNATDAAFAALAATTTEPTADGVIAVGGVGTNFVRGVVIGEGADNATLSVRVTGWKLTSGTGLTTLWVPTVLGEYTATLCTMQGVAGSPVSATERFADTLALVANRGTDGQDNFKLSPTNNTPGHFSTDMKGSDKLQIQIATGSSATNGNLLIQFLSG